MKQKEKKERTLLNEISPESNYFGKDELHLNHLFEQYKIFIEMADRISGRRNLTNVFFLTINTSLVASIGFAFKSIKLIVPSNLIIFPIMGFIALNFIWVLLIRYYKNLNSAKYNVINSYEEYLPSKPFSEEWQIMKLVKKYKRLRLAVLEQWVPIIFIYLYILIVIFYYQQ